MYPEVFGTTLCPASLPLHGDFGGLHAPGGAGGSGGRAARGHGEWAREQYPVAHHRHRLPDALAPAALGTQPPRNRALAGAPRRSAAGRLPPSPAPIPGPTAHAGGSGSRAGRGRLTRGGGGSQLRPAPRLGESKGRGLPRKEAGPARGGGYCEFNYKE
ncbi:RGD1309036 [Phodopus roborovskii]|uniref:RGD1309036 protein n=1 Tax=Phodopus roborovskii TaxID=109678 RepID=A0AAV0AB89_PHORO|nr:RGD1309036 [Phodopus roborovskii]